MQQIKNPNKNNPKQKNAKKTKEKKEKKKKNKHKSSLYINNGQVTFISSRLIIMDFVCKVYTLRDHQLDPLLIIS